MAVRYYALAKGSQKTAVVESATATLSGDGVEIQVRLSSFGPDRAETIRLMRELEGAIIEDRWPPA